MRRFAVSILPAFFLLVFGSAGTAQAKANFSGTWALDKEKSEVNAPGGEDEEGTAPEVDITMVVDHKDPALKVTRNVGAGQQEKSTTVTLDVSGKESTEQGPRGATVVTKAAWEGDNLIVSTTRTRKSPNQTITMENKQVWSLSKDGKTLTIEITRKGPRGEKTRKMVYQKQ